MIKVIKRSALVIVIACFSLVSLFISVGCTAKYPEGVFPCTKIGEVTDECPDGWTCRAEGYCWSTPGVEGNSGQGPRTKVTSEEAGVTEGSGAEEGYVPSGDRKDSGVKEVIDESYNGVTGGSGGIGGNSGATVSGSGGIISADTGQTNNGGSEQSDAGSTVGDITGGTGTTGGAGGTGGAEGCDIVIPSSTDCNARLAPGDERICTIGEREYLVHVGTTMNPCKPTALVIDAHGATETMRRQRGLEEFCVSADLCWHGLGSGLAAESDTPGGGFIAVFPQGLSNTWSSSDASFMLDIVEEMQNLADIDPDKIYMMGFSNGASLTYQTGCPNSNIFRGLSPNAGGSVNCSSIVRPIPVITFSAEADFAYASAVADHENMVRLNNCREQPRVWITVDSNYNEAVCRTAKQDENAQLVPCSEVTSAPIEPTVCNEWIDCDEGVKVVFCEVAPNTEHGPDNAAVDAHVIYENNTLLNTPSLAWRFFKQFWKEP